MARVERRLAAILAADIVGYSRLIEQDEASTLAAIKSLREQAIDPLLAEHKGRIAKLMGDGAIVEFASVVDAVACAVAVQKAVADRQAKTPPERRIVFRIGINLGDVVVEGDDLLGDGVNVAARLEQLCEPGGVLVSGTAFDHLQGRLGMPLEFTGEQQVKNIARSVRAYRVRMDGTAARLRVSSRRLRRLALPAVAALLLVLALAAGAWWWWPAGPSAGGRPAIAVLPFANMGGDEATGRLADGITEDVITDLARFRDLDVIARNSTETYKGKPVDVRQVGRDLGVGYVLEGSLRRQGDQLRVTAQLVDARTGAHVWADGWDRPAQDLFAVQEELAERVANALTGSILWAERAVAKRRRPQDLGTYELYLLGSEARSTKTEEGVQKGIELLKRAVAIDPDFSRAWADLAQAYVDAGLWSKNGAELYRAAVDSGRRAVQLDPMDAQGYAALGSALGFLGDLSQAEAALDRALQLNPGSADVLATYAGWQSSFGKPEKGAEAAEHAIRLNPNYGAGAAAAGAFGYAFFMAGRYEEALRVLSREAEDTFNEQESIEFASSLAGLGRTEEAKAAAARALARFPHISVERHISRPDFIEHERRRYLETMPRAGLPLCAKPEELAGFSRPVHLPQCDAERAKVAAPKT